MTLAPGNRLGVYEILAPIGAGGMGEVYRAADTRLGREVAIKVLPAEFAGDPERLARFEREARVLASLNHPGIAAIYGFERGSEQAGGVPFLVLEYVPGDILRGPMPVENAVGIARQMAEAIEYAHEKGVLHRDLKPANIKVTPEGKVKVLDFGLAKAFADETLGADPGRSPTMSAAATRTGVILGTAAYMSPEQARAKPLDHRTDIWSFGCVLYEILTGRLAFGGETVPDVIAAVIGREPDWAALPAACPAGVVKMLRRCVEKDLHRRLRHIADARFELEEAQAGVKPVTVAAAPVAVQQPARWRRWLLPALAGSLAVAAAALGVALWRALSAPRPVIRALVAVPAGDRIAIRNQPSVALSPDGSKLAYVATRGGRTQLFLRRVDQFDAAPVSGAEDANGPFFSPDGEWIGFMASGKLKKVLLSGGAALTLCEAPNPRGATWAPDDTIIFSPDATPGRGLSRVSANGGTPELLTKADPANQESHRWPHILPGGKAVLFTALGSGVENRRLEVLSLDTGKRRSLVTGAGHGQYLPSGHVVYSRGEALFAAPFDPGKLEITGRQFPVLEGVSGSTFGYAQFSVSGTGSLLYVAGGSQSTYRTLFWVDRKGTASPVARTGSLLYSPRVSPDGRLVAISSAEAGNIDVWIRELARDTHTRLTFDATSDAVPVWSPDGKRIVFRCAKGLCSKPADGSGVQEQLTTSGQLQMPSSWSPDGKWLAYDEQHPSNATDIWVLAMEGERKPRPFLQTQFTEWGARFSPDGRWLAYSSNESGRFDVYVQPFPGPGGKRQVSTEGGVEPVWSRNGKELFYRNGDKLMVMEATPGGASFVAGKPRVLFDSPYFIFSGYPNLDVSADGQRFLMIREGGTEDLTAQLNLVVNWFEELKGRK